MRIKMNSTRRGTEDGFHVSRYLEGEIYDVRDHMARQFIGFGWAEAVYGEVPTIPETLIADVAASRSAMSAGLASYLKQTEANHAGLN